VSLGTVSAFLMPSTFANTGISLALIAFGPDEACGVN